MANNVISLRLLVSNRYFALHRKTHPLLSFEAAIFRKVAYSCHQALHPSIGIENTKAQKEKSYRKPYRWIGTYNNHEW